VLLGELLDIVGDCLWCDAELSGDVPLLDIGTAPGNFHENLELSGEVLIT